MPKFQAPKGTRDLYPEDVLRQRYITQAWRDVSIRHGFDEIAGPTFEHLHLYTVKSGEGIVSELFSFRREGGDDDYALRPEFTPTLARMYAARARQLPQPTKWFTAGPYFRAEKPQRGRLREFLQWNVDVMGLPGGLNAEDAESAEARAQADAEVVECCVALLKSVGLEPGVSKVVLGSRDVVESTISAGGVSNEHIAAALTLLDARNKLELKQLEETAKTIKFDFRDTLSILRIISDRINECVRDKTTGTYAAELDDKGTTITIDLNRLQFLTDRLSSLDLGIWSHFAYHEVVRGLAYYTGTVFEVIADGERAVCGGGRYDKLVEMFGGPPTPAVGFGMGDVVLSLLLDDKGLMPDGAELMEAVSRPGASVRPEAFVIPGGDTTDADVNKAVAMLRRGPEMVGDRPVEELKSWRRPTGLHARRSYKSTRNVGKLLKDATNQHARFAVILESADAATIKDLDSGVQSDAKYAVGDELRREMYTRLGRGRELEMSES